MLTAEQVRELFDYDSSTGYLIWKKPAKHAPKKLIGQVAGNRHHSGYSYVKINSKLYAVHRIIWLREFGVWPDGDIDHINHKKSDNRLSNLRDVPHRFNVKHNPKRDLNTSGRTGVYHWEGKWRARIGVKGRNTHLGTFDTIVDAVAARMRAEKEYGYNDPEHPSNG